MVAFNPTVFTPISNRRLARIVVIFPMIIALAGRPGFQETSLFPTSASASSILRGSGTSDRDVGLGVSTGLLVQPRAFASVPGAQRRLSADAEPPVARGHFVLSLDSPGDPASSREQLMLAADLEGELQNIKEGGQMRFRTSSFGGMGGNTPPRDSGSLSIGNTPASSPPPQATPHRGQRAGMLAP